MRTFFFSIVSFFILHAGLAGAMGGNPFNRGWFGAVPSSASPVCAPNESNSSVTPGWVPNDTKDSIDIKNANTIDFESCKSLALTTSLYALYPDGMIVDCGDRFFDIFNDASVKDDSLSYSSGSSYLNAPPGKPFRGHRYAYLGVRDGFQVSRFAFKTVASGSNVSFMLYRAYNTFDGSYDNSSAFSGTLDILGAAFDPSCQYQYDRGWPPGCQFGGHKVKSSIPLGKDFSSCRRVPYAGGYPVGTFPSKLHPVSKVCDYENISIPMPNEVHQGEEIYIQWTLNGAPLFTPALETTTNFSGSGTTSASFSIDDIALDDKPVVPPNFTCDSLEIAPNGDPHCKLDSASTDNPLYFLRVIKAEQPEPAPKTGLKGLFSKLWNVLTSDVLADGPATVSRIFKTLTGSNFSQPGDYTVDAICQQPLVNGTQGICGHSAMKAKIKVSDPNSKPLAARLTETTAVVFPPKATNCTQAAASFNIYRKDNPQSGDGAKIDQQISRKQLEQGYVDTTLKSTTLHAQYAIEPLNEDGEAIGRKLGWADTNLYDSANVSVSGFPLPGSPTRIKVSFANAQTNAATDSNIPVKLVRADEKGALGFTTALPANNQPNPAQMNLVQAPSYKPQVTLTSAQGYVGYASLMKDPAALLSSPEADDYEGANEYQNFWVVTGDLAKSTFSEEQVKAALGFFTPPNTAPDTLSKCSGSLLANLQTTPDMRMDLCQCSFEGDQFVCKSPIPSAVLSLTIPAPNQKVGNALTKFYFDPAELKTGVLRSPTWKNWADQKQHSNAPLYLNADKMPSLSNLDLDNAPMMFGYALGMATYDALPMVAWHNKTPNCLADFLCAPQDRLDYFANHFYNQYIDSFLATSPTLPDAEAENIARGNVAVLGAFTARDLQVLEALRKVHSPVAALIDSMSIANQNMVNAIIDPNFSAKSFSPVVKAMGAIGSAGLESLFMAVVQGVEMVAQAGCYQDNMSQEQIGDRFHI